MYFATGGQTHFAAGEQMYFATGGQTHFASGKQMHFAAGEQKHFAFGSQRHFCKPQLACASAQRAAVRLLAIVCMTEREKDERLS